MQPRGDFAELLDLLTRQMAGAAANRIRRANFLDLAADTLEACRVRLDNALPKVLRNAIGHRPAARPAGPAARRDHADRTAGQPAAVGEPALGSGRVAVGIQPVCAGAAGLPGARRAGGRRRCCFASALRPRSPCGALQGVRTWKGRREKHQADRGLDRAAAAGWDPAELRKAVIIVDGYAAEAGLDRRPVQADVIAAESETAAAGFVARVSADLDSLIARLAKRHTGWFTRFRYEILLLAMLGLLLYRLGKNFFYDSWLAEHPTQVHGIDFYLSAGFWLVLWCLVLLWSFCSRLRRGLRGAVTELAAGWQQSAIGRRIVRPH